MTITVKDAGGVNRTIATIDDLLPEVDTIGTRAYAYGAIQRISVGATDTDSTAITATEVLLYASVRCYILPGADPTATNSNGIPLEAGEKFHLRITSGHKISVIRDVADGYLHIIPVA